MASETDSTCVQSSAPVAAGSALPDALDEASSDPGGRDSRGLRRSRRPDHRGQDGGGENRSGLPAHPVRSPRRTVRGNPSRSTSGRSRRLINDQFSRLEELCQEAEIAVHKWHGDVSASAEATHARTTLGRAADHTGVDRVAFRQSRHIASDRSFGPLAFIVIDELHSFIGTERGAHLEA